MHSNSTYQTIPVTKNLSPKIEDIIGELKLDAETANSIARSVEENLEVRLQVCVKEEAGVKKLVLVSFSLLPSVDGIRSLARHWHDKCLTLANENCLNDEWKDDESWARYDTLIECRRELLKKLNGK